MDGEVSVILLSIRRGYLLISILNFCKIHSPSNLSLRYLGDKLSCNKQMFNITVIYHKIHFLNLNVFTFVFTRKYIKVKK